jgi:hypothetical protein
MPVPAALMRCASDAAPQATQTRGRIGRLVGRFPRGFFYDTFNHFEAFRPHGGVTMRLQRIQSVSVRCFASLNMTGSLHRALNDDTT